MIMVCDIRDDSAPAVKFIKLHMVVGAISRAAVYLFAIFMIQLDARFGKVKEPFGDRCRNISVRSHETASIIMIRIIPR